MLPFILKCSIFFQLLSRGTPRRRSTPRWSRSSTTRRAPPSGCPLKKGSDSPTHHLVKCSIHQIYISSSGTSFMLLVNESWAEPSPNREHWQTVFAECRTFVMCKMWFRQWRSLYLYPHQTIHLCRLYIPTFHHQTLHLRAEPSPNRVFLPSVELLCARWGLVGQWRSTSIYPYLKINLWRL